MQHGSAFGRARDFKVGLAQAAYLAPLFEQHPLDLLHRSRFEPTTRAYVELGPILFENGYFRLNAFKRDLQEFSKSRLR